MKTAILIVVDVISVLFFAFNFNLDFTTSVIPGWHTAVNSFEPILLLVLMVLIYILIKSNKK
jgi:hypothetical protein